VHELWAYNNSLLKTWLELGEAKCRLASDRMPAPEIRHSMSLTASPDRVFAALTDPAEITHWNALAPAPRCDRVVGGRYGFGWKGEADETDGPGEILAFDPGRRLTYQWHGDAPTVVRWDLAPLPDGGTQLTLVHAGFLIDRNMMVDHNLGWADFLACLAIYVERGVSAGWSV